MSLDVYLKMKGAKIPVKNSSGIFIRENGGTKEISAEEWNRRHPDMEPVKFQHSEVENDEVYSANITHNLGKMAEEAGIYKALWRPEEIGITKAEGLVSTLMLGLKKLKAEPERFKKLNPENGWGDYEGLVGFVSEYLHACVDYPDADIEISR